VCLIARYLEARGIPTMVMGTALDIVKFGWPPRAVFMDFPLGHGGGPAFDPDQQLAIARQALAAFESIQNPGEILPLAQTWPGGDAWKTAAADQSAEDVRQPRDMTVRYQREEDRHLAEAAAGD
jgi:D-proline reductase (dithiol) PrdB